jgi:hypothetical protein
MGRICFKGSKRGCRRSQVKGIRKEGELIFRSSWGRIKYRTQVPKRGSIWKR